MIELLAVLSAIVQITGFSVIVVTTLFYLRFDLALGTPRSRRVLGPALFRGLIFGGLGCFGSYYILSHAL